MDTLKTNKADNALSILQVKCEIGPVNSMQSFRESSYGQTASADTTSTETHQHEAQQAGSVESSSGPVLRRYERFVI